jgi:outer membrane lipoprotein LolB
VHFLRAAVALLLLAGCAAPGYLLPAQDVQFELSGRIAVRYRDDAGSGNISWRHAASTDELLLTSPLGQGIARITRNGEEIALLMQDGKEHKASDAEALTEQVLGFRVPLAGLADWVRGRPAPELEARGWKVEYQGYDAERRPTRLRITYPGIELRLAISEWK